MIYDSIKWLLAAIHQYRDEIGAAGTVIIALYTIILARIQNRQVRDSRTLNRAYIAVEPAGIVLWSDGSKLVGHFIIKNAGNLPASEVEWVAAIAVDKDRDRTSFPLDERIRGIGMGIYTIPPHGEMTFGSPPIGLQTVLDVRDKENSCYLYVWGLVQYGDGFGKRGSARFWHRYDYRQTIALGPGKYELPAYKARHHNLMR
jgi:hypothetical protein